MISFAKRNLKLFFRDRTSVFFSLLAVFIIIGLYVLFLGDVWTSNLADVPGVRFLMDSWIMSGLLAITSMTTTMGAFGIMVEDKTRKINKDFISSPLKKSSITGGYIISAFVIGVIMTILALVLAEIYIVAYGGELLRPVQMLKVLGLIILSTFMNTSLVFFLVSFFNRQHHSGDVDRVSDRDLPSGWTADGIGSVCDQSVPGFAFGAPAAAGDDGGSDHAFFCRCAGGCYPGF